ncbi:MAG TPA: PQQ-dependent sugar dehydrogenase, partial [Bacteroidia bacterium]|nr:PQQ-dependent sugar dehydrogenase [Bacteroidia bacterium]
MKKFLLLILFSGFASFSALSQVLNIQALSSGLLFPVGIHNSGIPGDNRLFILEKRGRIKIVNRLTGAVTATPFLDIYNKVYPVTSSSDERGLLGLAFHPNYASNGYFYVNYINTSGRTIIARYQVSSFADTAMVNSEQVIMNIRQPFANHNGGNLMFGPKDGYLYISLGDGGSSGDPGNRAQNKDSLLGKILRIDVNTPSSPGPPYLSVPGNPFYGAIPGRDEIFDWGLRNPWRCSFDRMTHDLWIADVGQNRREEINFRPACDTVGHNYGWRCYEGDTAYNLSNCQSQANYEAPVFVYAHTSGCSVTGGYVYRGGLEGSLFGKYLFTDFCQGKIWATKPNGSGAWTTTVLSQLNAQINNNYSSFGEDVYGELYLAGVTSGQIFRLRDTACAPTAYIHMPDTLLLCSGGQATFSAVYGNGLSYGWTISSGGAWTINGGQGTNVMTANTDLNTPAIIRVSVSNGTCAALSNSIVVLPYSKITGVDTLYCTSSPSVLLTGFPGGGAFSGPGVNGNIFDPAMAGAGTHTLYYILADTLGTCNKQASGCVFTSAKTVVVNNCTGFDEPLMLSSLRVFPNPGNA